MEAIILQRKFKLVLGSGNDQTLLIDDPLPGESIDDVKLHLTHLYPQIASSSIEGPEIEDDSQVYTIKAGKAGVKG